MATDPRLDAAGLSAGAAGPGAALTRALARIADLEKRVTVLEHSPVIQTGSGPLIGACRDGTPYLDTTGSKLYVQSAGVPKSVTLT